MTFPARALRNTRPISRRPRVERQVIALLRGEDTTLIKPRCLVQLRHLADSRGITVLPPGANYLSNSELTLLAWIAAAQRTAYRALFPPDPIIASLVERCALRLCKDGLLLQPFSLYSGWLKMHSPAFGTAS
ncbi:hypothetical protein WBP07_28355 [Novosphingobium sp. BL-8A]|uniref:hypothetical protein n=1 Tax=Novosphingobium sp. BL-8A TaxID=3127639 RepID=UPI003756B59A